MVYDVIIIGAGICGASLAFELSRYKNRVLLLDKENDVSCVNTKANSGIVHAGYDPYPDTNMAKYNVTGNAMIKHLAKSLDVPYLQCGSFVVAFDEDEIKTLEMLLFRGKKNGVPDISIISGDMAREIEPNLNHEIKAALYAKSAAVVSPWELCFALCENAVRSGVELRLNCNVTAISQSHDGNKLYSVVTNRGEFKTRFIVNAAGINCDTIASLLDKPKYKITPQKGEYYLLDKTQSFLTKTVIFQCPNKLGKGILVSPTAHGNIIVGPNAASSERDDTATTQSGLAYVRDMAKKSVPSLNFRENIRNFAGVRAVTDFDDFIVGEDENHKGFYHMAGIKSPGLTAAPAIAVDIANMLIGSGLSLEKNPDFHGTRLVIRFNKLDNAAKKQLVAENPLYGNVICRCETITEGEIMASLNSPIPPVSLDGVKRRVNAGMGRCQGGFCGVRVHELLAKFYGVDPCEIPLDRNGSHILFYETKAGDIID